MVRDAKFANQRVQALQQNKTAAAFSRGGCLLETVSKKR
jgi:hypothetical protein